MDRCIFVCIWVSVFVHTSAFAGWPFGKKKEILSAEMAARQASLEYGSGNGARSRDEIIRDLARWKAQHGNDRLRDERFSNIAPQDATKPVNHKQAQIEADLARYEASHGEARLAEMRSIPAQRVVWSEAALRRTYFDIRYDLEAPANLHKALRAIPVFKSELAYAIRSKTLNALAEGEMTTGLNAGLAVVLKRGLLPEVDYEALRWIPERELANESSLQQRFANCDANLKY